MFMNKIVSGLVVSSVLLASCGQKDVPQVIPESVSTSTPVVQQWVVENPTVLAANYELYNKGSVGEAENTVIFFHATWCPSCVTADKNLQATGLPEGTKVLKADFDTETELRKKYEVTSQHTFVQVDASGEMIQKWTGANSADDILEQISSDTAMMEKDVMMDKSEDVMMEKEVSETMEESQEAMMEKSEEAMMEKEETVMQEKAMEKQVIAAGTFANYTPELVGKSDNTVVFFYAAWCPSCVALEKAITSGTVPVGTTILKADFDTSLDLRKQYGVTSQHTLVQIDANGEMIRKWAGGNTLESIIEKL